MSQPPGYVDPNLPNHVCKLNKSLYGLKQAPCTWYHRLMCNLLDIGFTCSTADSSLFIYAKGSAIIYFLVYVDDILITGSDYLLLNSIISKLQLPFAMKNLGQLHYFLGIEALS